MPKIKIVLYKDKIRLYLDGVAIPLRRLPDLVPIHIDTVNPDSHGAVVLEGEAWYGMDDDFLPVVVNNETAEIEEKKRQPIEARSDSGDVILRDLGNRIELEIRYRGNFYRLRYDKTAALPSAISPHLISLRVIGRLDNDFISFLFKELKSKPIKELIRKILREIHR